MGNEWSHLKGVNIIDVSNFLPGPYATMLLSSFGAEIIKVETPGFGDPIRLMGLPIYQMLNTNKKSITLNLKSDRGKEIFKQLASQADAVVEGFRPKVMSRLGLGFEDLQKVNSALVYCSISGFGQDGPYADKPAHDLNYLALGGYFGIPSQVEDKIARPNIRLADITAALFAALSLSVAVVGARQTGQGQHLDVSIHDAVTSLVAPMAIMMQDMWGDDIRKMSHIMPDNDLFETKDGRFFCVGIMENKFWIALRDILKVDFPDIANPEYDDRLGRMNHKLAVHQLLSSIFVSKTLKEWKNIFEDQYIPCSPVLNHEELLDDPHVKHRDVIRELSDPGAGEKIKQIGFPVKFSESLDDIRRAPPTKGEHSEEILIGLGYSKEDLKRFKSEKII